MSRAPLPRPVHLALDLLRIAAQATLLATLLAAFFWLLRIRPYLGTLQVCLVFSLVMWPGFRLLRPFLAVPLDGNRTALRVALASTFRMGLAYTSLLLLAVGLTRLLLDLDLFAQFPVAVTTYLVGFTVTVSINGFHLTQALVNAERTRAAVEAEHQRQTMELEAARSLQLSLLPDHPPVQDLARMAWAMRTASEVGGDHYDVRLDEQGTLHGAFGDATGHGLRAGMVTVAVKSHFRTGTGNPAQDLLAIGRGVKALGLPNTAMALTLWRLEGHHLSLANAGMPPALLWRAAEGRVEPLPLKAPPVGQLARPLIATLDLDLAPGDTLLFASDGLPECFDPTGCPFGYSQVPDTFAGLAHLDPEAIITGMLAAADRHAVGHPLADDLSLFVLRLT